MNEIENQNAKKIKESYFMLYSLIDSGTSINV